MSTAVAFPADQSRPLREPPHNFDAEQALLGAILVNNLCYGRVAEFLRPEHFAHAAHAQIYDACMKLIERGQIANPLTLKNQFDQYAELEKIGGAQYLARLAASATTIINAADYGRIVFDLHLRRQLIDLGEWAVNDAYDHDPEVNAQSIMESIDQKLTGLMAMGMAEGGPAPIAEGLQRAIEWTETAYKAGSGITGVRTGLSDLDKHTGGLRPGNLIICGARPGMGKTTWAATIAKGAAVAMKDAIQPEGFNDGVAFFSLEMSEEELSGVLMAAHTSIGADRQLNGNVTANEFDRLVQASRSLAGLPIWIDATPGLTISAIRARCRALKRRKKLSLAIVDYLQLITPEGRRPTGNRVEDVSAISRGLKLLAKELGIPIVALSQLSREVEKRENKRPMKADLRESGAIEQDADVIVFLYRAEYYLEALEPPPNTEAHDQWATAMEACRNILEQIIDKARLGRRGTIKAYYDASKSLILDLDLRPVDVQESFQL